MDGMSRLPAVRRASIGCIAFDAEHDRPTVMSIKQMLQQDRTTASPLSLFPPNPREAYVLTTAIALGRIARPAR